MSIEWIFAAAAVSGVVVGTWTDLKGRWVPDWISYFLIFLGIGGHGLLSVLTLSIWPFVWSLAGAGAFYGIAAAMYYFGAWGGGDAKLFIGLGALLPLYPTVLLGYFNPSLAPWPFLFTLWVNILLFGALFGLLASIGLAIKHRKKFNPVFVQLLKKNKLAAGIASATLPIPIGLLLINNSFYSAISTTWIILVAFLFLFFGLRAVEESCMLKYVAPSALVEGDWLAEDVKVGGKIVYKPSRSGIEKRDIQHLIGLEQQRKLKQVLVKEGLPYIPAFLAGLLTSLIFGDLFFIVIGGVF